MIPLKSNTSKTFRKTMLLVSCGWCLAATGLWLLAGGLWLVAGG